MEQRLLLLRGTDTVSFAIVPTETAPASAGIPSPIPTVDMIPQGISSTTAMISI